MSARQVIGWVLLGLIVAIYAVGLTVLFAANPLATLAGLGVGALISAVLIGIGHLIGGDR